MLHLLAPASSSEAVIAAVQSGAEMIYIEYGAAPNDRGLDQESLAKSLRYCRVRGCRAAVAMDELIPDDGLSRAVERAVFAVQNGADAILVRDVGFISVLRRVLPETPLWGGVRMDIHSVEGAMAASALGLAMITLAPELDLEQIQAIARAIPSKAAVCVHGPVCFGHSGQCHISAMNDRTRSDSCLRCAEPCRERLSLGGRMDDHPLSTPDLCLIDHLQELKNAGVAFAVIGGRFRRPEYSAFVGGLYSRAIREQVLPTQEEREWLGRAFVPHGLGLGGLTPEGETGILSPPAQADRASDRMLADVRRGYMNGELRRVPVKLYAVIRQGQNAVFAAEDDQGHRAVHQGHVPIDLGRQGLSDARVKDVLYRTGGTPYTCGEIHCAIDPDLDYPEEAIDEARRDLLAQITQARRTLPVPAAGRMPEPPEPLPAPERTHLIIQVTREEQLTEALAAAEPDYLYVPAELLASGAIGVEPFRQRGAKVVAVLPRIITDGEAPVLRELLAAVRAVGVREALAGSLGLVPAVLQAGMTLRGDFGLNAANGWTVRRLAQAGFQTVTASFELSARQIWALAHAGQTEMIVYGRVPVMVADRCLIRASAGRCACSTPTSMSDPFGGVYPVEKEFGCRNVIYDGRKIFLADRPDIYGDRGLWGVRLLFTTESARECVSVAERFRGRNHFQPNNVCRGLYPKGAL